jgi:hypothetical protein
MKTFALSLFATVALAFAANSALAAASGTTVITNGTLINPGTGKVTENAVITIQGDHISAVSQASATDIPKKGERVIDARGKFVLPGYIDTHVHFFQSGDIYTRPDAVDLTSVRSYKDEHAWIEHNKADVLARYIRCGITSVVDVGGPMWNFTMRKFANSTEKAPRVAAAGPLISSVSREQLVLNGDAPIVKIDTPEQGVQLVQKLAKEKPDYIKIWYIVNEENPVAKFRPVVHAVIAESHRLKLRVAVHATELEAARASVEEGADLLVHSVTDKPVDDAFVKLLKERGTILTPTLVVFERYGRTFANKLNLTTEEKAWGNPEVIASLDVTKIPADAPGRRRHHRRRDRCGEHRHDSWPRAFPRVSVDERSWADSDADSAKHDGQRRQNVRRRNRRQDRRDRAREIRRSRHPKIEPARRRRAYLGH